MITNFKIHIGKMIRRRVWKKEMESSRICRLFGWTEEEIMEMYKAENLYPDVIMKWCKLLDYDFFRIYTQHLILYAPMMREKYENLTAALRFQVLERISTPGKSSILFWISLKKKRKRNNRLWMNTIFRKPHCINGYRNITIEINSSKG